MGKIKTAWLDCHSQHLFCPRGGVDDRFSTSSGTSKIGSVHSARLEHL